MNCSACGNEVFVRKLSTDQFCFSACPRCDLPRGIPARWYPVQKGAQLWTSLTRLR